MKFLKENWFKIAVIILLIMCYSRLGTTPIDTNGSVDRVSYLLDSKLTEVVDSVQSLEYYLDEMNNELKDIESNTANIWYAVQ